MTYTRFVAIGDSLTLGSGDVYPDGRPRGFADMLAHAVRAGGTPVTYANLARPSVRTTEVLQHQVPDALSFQPDLVTAIAGVNDVIAVSFPADRVAVQLEAVFATLRAGAPAACIATATLPDLSHLSRLARMWRGRVQALNAAIRQAAVGHGIVVVDLERMTPMGREDLALDRVHPSPLGHRHVARSFAAALGLPAPDPAYLHGRPRAEQLLRVYRTAVVAPRFITKRLARRALIAGQPAKRPQLQPI